MPEKTYSVFFSPQFYDDISSAMMYYESRQKGLGKRFNQEVVKSLNAIRITPHYQIYYDDIRCLLVNKFPYLYADNNTVCTFNIVQFSLRFNCSI